MISAKEDFQPGTKAVIYCRVSSSKQSKVGDGLVSQQTRCREYVRYKGLEVVETFTDDMSGSLATRPGMTAMLAYLNKHRGKEPIVVIIDDISRLARGMEAHLQLHANHTDAKMTSRYNRKTLTQTERVAELRVAHREQRQNKP